MLVRTLFDTSITSKHLPCYIGYTSNKTADATKNTDKANKAAKEFRKTVLSFDELNMLNAPDTSSSGSGSNPNSGAGAGGKYTGPSASEMFETIEVPNSMNKLAEMFKDAIAKSDFTDIGRMISDKLSNALESIDWQKIYHYADNFGKDLATLEISLVAHGRSLKTLQVTFLIMQNIQKNSCR